MNARRLASLAGTVAVTVIAAVGSYDHQRALALMAGQSPLLATLLPLSVDGLLLVATIALGDGRRHRGSAWLAFFVGVAASLAANVLATPGGALARVVSAWPAIALLLTVEVLARSGKAAPVATPSTAPVEAPAIAEPVANTPAPLPVAAPVAGTPAPASTPAPVATPARLTGAAAKVAALLADRPDLSSATVAAELGIAGRTARRHLATARTALAGRVAAHGTADLDRAAERTA